jgi:hypothetical protein
VRESVQVSLMRIGRFEAVGWRVEIRHYSRCTARHVGGAELAEAFEKARPLGGRPCRSVVFPKGAAVSAGNPS